jgi:hypothetical protein
LPEFLSRNPLYQPSRAKAVFLAIVDRQKRTLLNAV